MDNQKKIKRYEVPKRLNVTAQVIGLNYNTFFVFIVIGAIILMTGGKNGIPGLIAAAVILAIIYFILFFIQTKLGPKELGKKINDFMTPIISIEIRKSFRRIKKEEDEI